MKGKNSALAVCRLIKPGFFTIAGMKPAPGTGVQHKQNKKENYNHIEMNAVCAFLTKSFAGTGITSPGNV